jgi:hypothetical protein
MANDYLLLETGDKLILEDGTGDLILESSGAADTLFAQACLSWLLVLVSLARMYGL